MGSEHNFTICTGGLQQHIGVSGVTHKLVRQFIDYKTKQILDDCYRNPSKYLRD